MKNVINRTRLKFGILIFIMGLSINKASTQNSIAKTHTAQIRFNITAFLSDRLNLENSGTPLLSSSSRLGGEASILYSHPLLQNFRLNAGLGWSIYSYNYSYHFLVPPGSIFDTGSNTVPFFTTRGYDPHVENIIFTIPLSVQNTFNLIVKNKVEANLEAGIKLNLKEKFPYGLQSRSVVQLSDHTEAEYFGYDFESNGKKIFVSYLLKVGLTKDNTRGNIFNLNVVYNFSPAIIGRGEYEFSNLGFESFGTMKQNANYFGLEIGYGIGLKKGKSVRKYEP